MIYEPRAKNIATEAHKMLDRLNAHCFPLNMQLVLSNIPSVAVVPYSRYCEDMYAGDKQLFLKSIGYTKDGFTAYDRNNNHFLILYDDCYYEHVCSERQQWTLAHEFGHIALGHFDSDQYVSLSKKAKESECNHFASELLAPTPVLYELYESGIPLTESDIACTFGLSMEASRYRLMDFNRMLRNADIKKYYKYYGQILYTFWENISYTKDMHYEMVHALC